MKTLTNLQKAILKNVLTNFKKGLNTWIENEELSLPDKITLFFEEKTGINFSGMKPSGDEALDFSVKFDMFIDHLISDVNNNTIHKDNFQDVAFMLENQGWMSNSISNEVIEMAEFSFPKLTKKT